MNGMNTNSFHNAQEEMTNSDEEPRQEQNTVVTFDTANSSNFNPVNLEIQQTYLIMR